MDARLHSGEMDWGSLSFWQLVAVDRSLMQCPRWGKRKIVVLTHQKGVINISQLIYFLLLNNCHFTEYT